tara:strand:+ start:164 stop:466 length:303 start_codon:yes stop_codon:yes gene_type:complete
MKQYELKVVPLKGVTLAKRTRDEWALGYDFKVISCSSPMFLSNEFVTSKEVRDAEDRYNIKFEVKFFIETVKEHVSDLIERDYAFEQYAKRTGMIRKRGF